VTPEQFIARIGANRLFHFTDRRNLGSIREHGLLSWRGLQERGISPAAPGGNEWSHDADELWGLDRYVHLCFFNEHPMEYRARQDGRIEHSVFLKIQPEVLRIPGVLFSADVSNKSGVPILDMSAAAEALDLDVVYQRLDWRDPSIQARRQVAKKYEVLVPDHVPLHLILGLK